MAHLRPAAHRVSLSLANPAGPPAQAAGVAMQHGWAVNLGGGMHHASRDQGQGWCMFDDHYLALRMLRRFEAGPAAPLPSLAPCSRLHLSYTLLTPAQRVHAAGSPAEQCAGRCTSTWTCTRATGCAGISSCCRCAHAPRGPGMPASCNGMEFQSSWGSTADGGRRVGGAPVAQDPDLYVMDVYNADVFPQDKHAERAVDCGVRLHCGAADKEYLSR